MTSVYGPAASHERRVKGLEQLGEDIARWHGAHAFSWQNFFPRQTTPLARCVTGICTCLRQAFGV